MINAKEELLREIEGKEAERVKIFLRRNKHTIEGALSEVLPSLNFIYDNGFGIQELHGVIWYTDGTWSERQEYDGSECWAYKKRPNFDISFN